VNAPVGVALDPSRERIYWANSGANRISFARLDGSDGGDLVTTGATVDGPAGVAIDSSEGGRIYWANRNADRISFADLNGTGGGDLATTGATVDGPVGVGLDLSAGRIYWGNFDGNKLSFAKLDGSGGDDLEVRGATLSGPNFPVAVSWASSSTLAVGSPKLNRKRGTATLPVRAPARGTLRLNGMGLVPRRLQSRRGGERLTLSVVAKGKAKRRLARKGTLKVRARLVFTSTAGIAQVRTKRITLKKARRC
jgi:hypothetical protein